VDVATPVFVSWPKITLQKVVCGKGIVMVQNPCTGQRFGLFSKMHHCKGPKLDGRMLGCLSVLEE
jgi:hypothetical protein